MSLIYNKVVHLLDLRQSKIEEGFPTIKGREQALNLVAIEEHNQFKKEFKKILEQRGSPDWADEEGKGILFPMISCLLQEANAHKMELMTGVKKNKKETKFLNEEPKVDSVPSLAKIPGIEFTPQPTYLQGIKNETEWTTRRNALWIDVYKHCWETMHLAENGKPNASSLWVRKHLHVDNLFLIHLLTLTYPSQGRSKSGVKALKKVYLKSEKVPMWSKVLISNI